MNAATRSRMMQGIRSANTVPEKQVRSLLHRQGFRFRLNVAKLPGKPDIVLPRYRAVVMVNGCFWHGHNCALFRMPSTRPEFWTAKIGKNRENDHRANERLIDAGWRVATVWECALKGRGAIPPETLIARLCTWLRSDDSSLLVLSANQRGEAE